MTTNDVFPSKYMKAEDFEEGEVKILTIRNVELEEIGGKEKKESKPVMSFREPNTKAMVVNKTNWATIAKFYGDESDDWIGKKVALWAIEVESFGDVVRAIRVKTKMPQANGKPAPTPPPTEDDDLFDEGNGLPDMQLAAGDVVTRGRKN